MNHVYECAHCLRKHTFTHEETWFCKCGCVYKPEGDVIRVWAVGMVESKRPEWAYLQARLEIA